MRRTIRPVIVAAAAGALVLGGTAAAMAAQGPGGGAPMKQHQAGPAAECDETHSQRESRNGPAQGFGEEDGAGSAARHGRGLRGMVKAGQGHGRGAGGAQTLELGTVTPEQQQEMAFMAEEEKMAGDLYEAFFEMYGVRIFANIAASEDRHADAVRDLLSAYGLEDPTAGLNAGEFTIPEAQAMYDELLAQGSESLEAALDVGVAIEEADIVDLRDAIDGLAAPRAVAVYENLLSGSQNHLAAFSR